MPNFGAAAMSPRTVEDAAVSIKRVDQWCATLRALFKWAAILGISYNGYKSIAVLAGKFTFASIAIQFWAEKTVFCTLSVIIGIIGIGYGKMQAGLRHRNIKSSARRIQELESGFDSKRTSSNLTVMGTTREEDRE